MKDYLRELPTPLITDPLYQVVLEAMSNRTVGLEVKETTTALLNCLPEAEKVRKSQVEKENRSINLRLNRPLKILFSLLDPRVTSHNVSLVDFPMDGHPEYFSVFLLT